MSSTHAGRRVLPSLVALRAFEAGARLGSFTRAAEELLITQGAVSRHVRNLESFLEVTLFNRAGRHLSLTMEGREYITSVSEAFDQLSAATAALRRRPNRGMTVSMLPALAVKWFVPRLMRFSDSCPEIDLHLSLSRELINFDRDGVDVAIRYGRGDWEGTHAEELLREVVFPICSPRLLDEPTPLRKPEDLAGVTLLHGNIREDWTMWLRAAGCNDVDATRGPKFDDHASLIQAAIQGLGVGLGRGLMVADDLANGSLVMPFSTRLRAHYSYWLVTPRRQAPHPGFSPFREWVLREIAESKKQRRIAKAVSGRR
jgi:LysR family transcriptional regulator, glycine cleavage system transcriptional activator